MKRFTRKRLLRVLGALALLYVLGGLVLYLVQDQLLFHPEPLPADHRFSFTIPHREVNLPLEGRNLSLVRFQASGKPRGAVLYFHGNMRNVERYADVMPLFTSNGYEVWMMDYPGFGKSTGERSEEGMRSDARRIYELARREYDPSQLVIYGRSIGTGPASGLAASEPCKMLILETPYYSIDALARHYFPIYPVVPLTRYSFPVHRYLDSTRAPVYLIHGSEDEVVPYDQSKRLKKEHPSLHLITIPEGHHNDLADFPLFRATLSRLLFLP